MPELYPDKATSEATTTVMLIQVRAINGHQLINSDGGKVGSDNMKGIVAKNYIGYDA